MYPVLKKVNVHYWRPLLLTGTFCLCLWIGLLGASYARADDPVLVPEAPGSISGVVTDSNGAPLPGIEVSLYINGYGAWSIVRSLTTDANGAYKAAVLATAVYRIRFRDPQGAYATTYYNNAMIIDSATDVPVSGNDIAGINAQLTAGGGISGTVTFTGTASLNNCPVCNPVQIMRKIADRWQTVTTTVINLPTGAYSVTALQPSIYRVCVSPIYGYFERIDLGECYDNIASDVENAQDVSVVASQVTPNINLVLGDSADLATLGGQVTSPSGAPLDQIAVSIGQWTAYGQIAIRDTRTDNLGRYQVSGLAPGDYIVQFTDTSGPYLDQYYNNTNRYEFADRITLERREQRLNINATLVPGGQITGTVILLHQTPAVNGSVVLLSASNIPNSPPIFYASVDPNTGVYRSDGLPAGDYRLSANVFVPPVTFLAGYYGGADYDHATLIHIATGEIKPNINIEIGEGVFDGSIAGQVTAQATPQAGIKVSLFYPGYPGVNSFYTYTDATGHYTIGGLADGAYLLGFTDPTGIYATTFYTNQITRATAQLISIINSRAITNANVALIRGGAISGHVALHNGKPAANTQVNLYTTSTVLDINAPMITQAVDANGNYKVQGLLPGPYRVCFVYHFAYNNKVITSETLCYSAVRPSNLIDTAADIPVTAGVETKGINMVFGSAGPGRLYFPQIAR